jgi:hypothetical protein
MPVRGGHSLPNALRQRLERSFGADLSLVRVHRCTSARRITEDLGTRACAVEGAILLGGEVPAAVLVHEVVHLLQGRLFGNGTVAAAEEEAHRLAARALAGLPCRVTIPADAAQPLCWEEAGHYYTIYYTALACGLPNHLAMRIAFWAQFPDEVSELDAVKAGFDIPRAGVGAFTHWVGSGFGVPDALQDMYVEINNGVSSIYGGYGRMAPVAHDTYKDLQVNLDVQRGLHCLTGASWEVETRRRTEISIRAAAENDDYFEFGVSLHCYGDSFAHRDHDSGKMYPSVVGHGIETQFTRSAGDEASKMLHAQHPDALSPARRREFTSYVQGLHGLFSTCFPQFKNQSLQLGSGAEATALTLAGVITEQPDAAVQINMIRQAAQGRLKTPMHDYKPELQDDVYFKDFFNQTKPVAVSRHHVDRGLFLARIWNPS